MVHPECARFLPNLCKATTYAHPAIIDSKRFIVNWLVIMIVCTFVCTYIGRRERAGRLLHTPGRGLLSPCDCYCGWISIKVGWCQNLAANEAMQDCASCV